MIIYFMFVYQEEMISVAPVSTFILQFSSLFWPILISIGLQKVRELEEWERITEPNEILDLIGVKPALKVARLRQKPPPPPPPPPPLPISSW